jgi:hypothetical protein
VTVPVAVDAFVPDSVAWSVTAVLTGTEIDVPDCPPPDRDVVVVVLVLVLVTVTVVDPLAAV